MQSAFTSTKNDTYQEQQRQQLEQDIEKAQLYLNLWNNMKFTTNKLPQRSLDTFLLRQIEKAIAIIQITTSTWKYELSNLK